MKITLAQINPVVGDIKGNLDIIKSIIAKNSSSSDLIVFPEMCLTGYPPRDLLENRTFISETTKALKSLTQYTADFKDTGIIIGSPTPSGRTYLKPLFNSAVLLCGGKTLFVQHKTLLPTYDVFDEGRYFNNAVSVSTVRFKGKVLGISICEDMWYDYYDKAGMAYGSNPLDTLAKKGAEIFINISASPFYLGKEKERLDIIKNNAVRYKAPFVFVNQTGANDELVFDGKSICVDKHGNTVAHAAGFKEETVLADTDRKGALRYKLQDEIASVYDALVTGVRDYVRKTGFEKTIVGLSGGIDSSVVAAIAKDALGSGNVLGISMPSEYTAAESIDYAEELASNLRIELKIIPIKGIYGAFKGTLKKELKYNDEIDISLQNIQARIRGNILMAFSNRFGSLVLSTGNKSEMAVGYCTLYGDMSGGVSVISDVPKTLVYKLAAYINRHSEIIPRKVISRIPTAELKPGQKDRDSLPAYDMLDKILYYYIECGLSYAEIVKKGLPGKTVARVIRLVAKNEYKRKQAAPGIKVTTKSFGMGRRLPIAARYIF